MIAVHRLAMLREVARAGSFAGAAAALRHTPSAVSQQIAALEPGPASCSSNAARVASPSPTPAGPCSRRSTRSTPSCRWLQSSCALAAGGPQALTVVTFPSAGEPLLAPALTAMTAAADHPVEITVIEAEPYEALSSVRDGRADLGLVYHFHTPQPPSTWSAAAGPGSYTALVADPLRLLVSAGHPLAGRPSPWPSSPATAGSRTGGCRRCHRHARRSQRFPFPGGLPRQRLPLHERPGRRRCWRRPGAQSCPHWPPRRARPPDHPSAHPLHRRLAPQTAPAEPGRRTTARGTPHSRSRYRRPRLDTGDRRTQATGLLTTTSRRRTRIKSAAALLGAGSHTCSPPLAQRQGRESWNSHRLPSAHSATGWPHFTRAGPRDRGRSAMPESGGIRMAAGRPRRSGPAGSRCS